MTSFWSPAIRRDLEHRLDARRTDNGRSPSPPRPAARRSTYLKVRDRQSYEFAAASAAVGLELEADGRTIRDLRVALGGVATKPWRARAVEDALIGKTVDRRGREAPSRLAMEGAVDHGGNRYKIELAPRVVARAIVKMGGLGMNVIGYEDQARRCFGWRG